MSATPRSKVPTWMVGLAVLAAAGAAIFFAQRRKTVTIWPHQAYLPLNLPAASPPAPMALVPPLQRIAAQQPVPTIRAGAVSRHGDRGACTTCHTVQNKSGAAIAAIRAQSSLPHQYPGGVCRNCHTLQTGSATQTVAAQRTITVKKTPTEGEWLGAEVVPITTLTAKQFNVPERLAGVVVAEVEAQAVKAGLKAGDVITAVNTTTVTTMDDFISATGRGKLGGGSVSIWRSGRVFSIWLGNTPAPAKQSEPPAAGPKRF